MSLVQVASESWGTVEDQAGNVRPNLPVSIVFRSDGSPATLVDQFGAPISNPVTDGNGQIPGYIEQGSYSVTIGGGPNSAAVTMAVEAITATSPQSGSANEPGTSVCVGTASQIIVPANPARIKLILSNLDTVNPVDISFGSDAVIGAGIRLQPYGPPFADETFTGIVYAIAQASNTCIGITEV